MSFLFSLEKINKYLMKQPTSQTSQFNASFAHFHIMTLFLDCCASYILGRLHVGSLLDHFSVSTNDDVILGLPGLAVHMGTFEPCSIHSRTCLWTSSTLVSWLMASVRILRQYAMLTLEVNSIFKFGLVKYDLYYFYKYFWKISFRAWQIPAFVLLMEKSFLEII